MMRIMRESEVLKSKGAEAKLLQEEPFGELKSLPTSNDCMARNTVI